MKTRVNWGLQAKFLLHWSKKLKEKQEQGCMVLQNYVRFLVMMFLYAISSDFIARYETGVETNQAPP